jgi:hypothetical protein
MKITQNKPKEEYSERGHDIEIQRTEGTGEFVGEANTRAEA